MNLLKRCIEDYSIRYIDKVKKATKPLMGSFQISFFSYQSVDSKGRFLILLNDLEWAEYLIEERLYLNNPFMKRFDSYESCSLLVEMVNCSEPPSVLYDWQRKFGYTKSLMIIERNLDSTDIFTFSGNISDHKKLSAVYQNQQYALRIFAGHFKKLFKSILKDMINENYYLPDLVGEHFYDKTQPYTSIDKEAITQFLKDIGLKNMAKVALLSKREKECMKLIVQGHSGSQAALTMNLSRRTVESYIENIKDKLEIYNKKDLIQLADSFSQLQLL